MKNYVVIIRVGASFGADVSGTPPLGKQLFEALAAFNPLGWGRLPEPIRSNLEKDFETGMVRLALDRSHDMPILQRAMAEYVFTFLPTKRHWFSSTERKSQRKCWLLLTKGLPVDLSLDQWSE